MTPNKKKQPSTGSLPAGPPRPAPAQVAGDVPPTATVCEPAKQLGRSPYSTHALLRYPGRRAAHADDESAWCGGLGGADRTCTVAFRSLVLVDGASPRVRHRRRRTLRDDRRRRKPVDADSPVARTATATEPAAEEARVR